MVVADTALGDVRGLEGFYHYRQYSAPDLARPRTFEDVWHLFVEGTLPSLAERSAFTRETAALRDAPAVAARAAPGDRAQRHRRRSPGCAPRCRSSPRSRTCHPPTTPTRRPSGPTPCGSAPPSPCSSPRCTAAPSGRSPIAPRPDLATAANYLYMIDGREPDPERARAIEQYLILTIDHGFNASTFTARVVTSTGADVGSAIVAALGSLSGPLHGGAPSRALDTLDAIGTPENTEPWVRERDRVRRRGSWASATPVYRTADPRSVLLHEVAESLGGPLVDFAGQVEVTVEKVLAELKPGRELHTNVEYYAGVVMELCGLPRTLFTPTFAASRVIGWCAQVMEQAHDTAIIRPSARYVGPPAPQPVPDAA